MTFLLALKIVPRYEGKRKVIQQGANKARTPAKKEAVKDTPNKKFKFMLFNHGFNAKN